MKIFHNKAERKAGAEKKNAGTGGVNTGRSVRADAYIIISKERRISDAVRRKGIMRQAYIPKGNAPAAGKQHFLY